MKHPKEMSPSEIISYLESRGFDISDSDTIADLREAVRSDLEEEGIIEEDEIIFSKNPGKKDYITLHPEHGVNPTIIQYICPVTGKTWESNELALLGFNKGKKAEMHTVMGYKPCPEVQELFDKGYIALIVYDSTKTTSEKEPYRTGDIIYIREEAYKGIFNQEPHESRFAFIDLEAMEKLKGMMPKD